MAALEAATPIPSPLQQAQRGGQPAEELLGAWNLVYASSGTYVTRTAAAQALLAASKLPGVGVSDVQQTLELSAHAGDVQDSTQSNGSSNGNTALRITNAAKLGLFVFGEWALKITGEWRVQDGVLATISFNGYSLQLVGLLGLIKLPGMAKVMPLCSPSLLGCALPRLSCPPSLPHPSLPCRARSMPPPAPLCTTTRPFLDPTRPRLQIGMPVKSGATAEFTTTYLSPSLRVARGRSRNIFVFHRS